MLCSIIFLNIVFFEKGTRQYTVSCKKGEEGIKKQEKGGRRAGTGLAGEGGQKDRHRFSRRGQKDRHIFSRTQCNGKSGEQTR